MSQGKIERVFYIAKQIMKKAFLVYPHQLFEDVRILADFDLVFLVEDPLFFSESSFHKQKLILHRASMKAYESYLQKNGIPIVYVEFHTLQKTGTIVEVLAEYHCLSVGMYDPVDDWLSSRVAKAFGSAGLQVSLYETPMFLTKPSEFQVFFAARKGARKYFMSDFYIWQRKRLNILVAAGKPVGGSWSFDKENRKKIPKGISTPEVFVSRSSLYVSDAVSYIQKHFSQNFGDTEAFWCPVTHADAKKHLKTFFEERFSLFGPYEDAMKEGSPSLFHSTISPLLNNGLLTPSYVIKEMQIFTAEHDIPLASVEGFVRQIIGWREYIRALYVLEGKNIRTKNYFKSKNKLPYSFWKGATSLDPVDHHINILRTYAYTHHIPRLMVLANVMNLCAIEPHDVYAWFMEMYIDAYDWVMVPNVYSMALYADGGLLTTKPYISSSHYILKMSNFKKGAWCETMDALFWNFVGEHFKKFEKESRLGFIGMQYKKMDSVKKNDYKRKAEAFKKDFGIHL